MMLLVYILCFVYTDYIQYYYMYVCIYSMRMRVCAHASYTPFVVRSILEHSYACWNKFEYLLTWKDTNITWRKYASIHIYVYNINIFQYIYKYNRQRAAKRISLKTCYTFIRTPRQVLLVYVLTFKCIWLKCTL